MLNTVYTDAAAAAAAASSHLREDQLSSHHPWRQTRTEVVGSGFPFHFFTFFSAENRIFVPTVNLTFRPRALFINLSYQI